MSILFYKNFQKILYFVSLCANCRAWLFGNSSYHPQFAGTVRICVSISIFCAYKGIRQTRATDRSSPDKKGLPFARTRAAAFGCKSGFCLTERIRGRTTALIGGSPLMTPNMAERETPDCIPISIMLRRLATPALFSNDSRSVSKAFDATAKIVRWTIKSSQFWAKSGQKVAFCQEKGRLIGGKPEAESKSQAQRDCSHLVRSNFACDWLSSQRFQD